MSSTETKSTPLTAPTSLGRPLALQGNRQKAAAVPLFVALTAAGAYMAFPLPGTPVPVTLQTLFVLLAGVLLGPWMGASAMAAYLALGVAGAPVFTGGGATLAWLLGPTGGYLVAFPAAAFVAGWLAGRDQGVGRLILAFALGTAVIFTGGVAQLAFMSGNSLMTAAAVGMLPFLPGAVVKGAIGVVATRIIRRRRDT